MELKTFKVKTLAHATEDEARIAGAVETVFGVETGRKKATGYWKNPIIIIEGSGGKKKAESSLRKLKDLKISNIPARCEKNRFFVRVDKEKLLLGRLAPGRDVQIIFGFEGHAPSAGKVASLVREYWKV